MGRGIRRLSDLRAWQACTRYKQAVYLAAADGPLSRDWSTRRQLEESVAGPPAHLAEGFGRFNPAEFSSFLVLARSSLVESRNHLRDAAEQRSILEASWLELDELAEAALREVTRLMEYLQSAQALRNACRPRERRIATGAGRRSRQPRSEKPQA